MHNFLGKHTILEKQLIIPTLLANKLIFNDFNKRPLWKKLLFLSHIMSLLLLEILHIAYLFSKSIEITELATIEETITSTMEVGTTKENILFYLKDKFQALLRLCALLAYKKRYMNMFDIMQKKFWPTKEFSEKEERKNTKFSKTVNMFSHLNTITAFITMFVLLCLPFLRQIREFPFKMWLPGVNLHKSPLFEIITIWQWITNYWTVLFGILCYDYIFVMFSGAIIAQLKMLQKALEHHARINGNEVTKFLESRCGNLNGFKSHEEKSLALFKICLEHHMVITNFVEDIYSAYSLPLLAQFAGTFNALCFSGYILVSVELSTFIIFF